MRGWVELVIAGLFGVAILVAVGAAWLAIDPAVDEGPGGAGARSDAASPPGAVPAGEPSAARPRADVRAPADPAAETPPAGAPDRAPETPTGGDAAPAAAAADATAGPAAAIPGAPRDVGGTGVTAAPPLGPIAALEPAPKVAEAEQPAEPERFFNVVVIDAGTIAVGDRRLRLADVDVPGADARCGDGSGREWSCGTLARTALRRRVQSRAVECRPVGVEGFAGDLVAVRCSIGKTDLAAWLVRHGWAEPADPASDALAKLAARARRDGRGLWQTNPKGLDDPAAEVAVPAESALFDEDPAAPGSAAGTAPSAAVPAPAAPGTAPVAPGTATGAGPLDLTPPADAAPTAAPEISR